MSSTAPVPCKYCQGDLSKVSAGMYQCEDCGRAVDAKYVRSEE